MEIKMSTELNLVEKEETLEEADRVALEMATLRKQMMLSQAENAELVYKNAVLQVYLKYKMDLQTDSISDKGVILRKAPKSL
jgi:hypothetical protein